MVNELVKHTCAHLTSTAHGGEDRVLDSHSHRRTERTWGTQDPWSEKYNDELESTCIWFKVKQISKNFWWSCKKTLLCDLKTELFKKEKPIKVGSYGFLNHNVSWTQHSLQVSSNEETKEIRAVGKGISEYLEISAPMGLLCTWVWLFLLAKDTSALLPVGVLAWESHFPHLC